MTFTTEHTQHAGRELSYYLRHHPEEAGLDMDRFGWVASEQVVLGMRKNNPDFTFEDLEYLVVNDNKGRFEFCDNGNFIRACQGHSIDIDLGLAPTFPPAVLYHGTAERFVGSIFEQGILPMSRNHVHLSLDETVAKDVGTRHGSPAVFLVNALKMHEDGYKFYLADNGVWLTDYVPVEYLQLM